MSLSTLCSLPTTVGCVLPKFAVLVAMCGSFSSENVLFSLHDSSPNQKSLASCRPPSFAIIQMCDATVRKLSQRVTMLKLSSTTEQCYKGPSDARSGCLNNHTLECVLTKNRMDGRMRGECSPEPNTLKIMRSSVQSFAGLS